MIGKMCTSRFPFYDNLTKSIKFKSRPILILAEPNGMDGDYTVLPVSTISRKEFIDPKYDIPLEKVNYPLLSLKSDCYIRTHKQTSVNRSEINFSKHIGDLKKDYSDTFIEVLGKVEEYTQEVVNGAI